MELKKSKLFTCCLCPDLTLMFCSMSCLHHPSKCLQICFIISQISLQICHLLLSFSFLLLLFLPTRCFVSTSIFMLMWTECGTVISLTPHMRRLLWLCMCVIRPQPWPHAVWPPPACCSSFRQLWWLSLRLQPCCFLLPGQYDPELWALWFLFLHVLILFPLLTQQPQHAVQPRWARYSCLKQTNKGTNKQNS